MNMKNLNHFTGIWKRLKVTVWRPLLWSQYWCPADPSV